MAKRRIYTYETGAVREALELAPRVTGVSRTASESARAGAMLEYAGEIARQEIEREEKIRAYQAMASDPERDARVRRHARTRIERGLL